jgi:RsiW-degrading membrane proteinase PrsW (M82 family)
MVGNIVQGNRLASAQGRDMGAMDEESDLARKVYLLPAVFIISFCFLLVKFYEIMLSKNWFLS